MLPCCVYSSIQKMEAMRSSERPVYSSYFAWVTPKKGILFRTLWTLSQIALHVKRIHNLNIVHYGLQSTLYNVDTHSVVNHKLQRNTAHTCYSNYSLKW
jgi:hypothetical protein